MSPLGKFILDRIEANGILTSRTLQIAAITFMMGGTFFTRYIAARQYVIKLGLEIQDPLY